MIRAASLLLSLLLSVAAVTACSSADEGTITVATNSPRPLTVEQPKGQTARTLADILNEVSPLAHPRDNTDSCAPSCAQLITTYPLSIYQWKTDKDARTFAGANPDPDSERRVGPFVLLFHKQDGRPLTTDKQRDAWVMKARDLLIH